jgi:exopolysaccharide biosynthesis polyprenyl glycosylphosphotransferase
VDVEGGRLMSDTATIRDLSGQAVGLRSADRSLAARDHRLPWLVPLYDALVVVVALLLARGERWPLGTVEGLVLLVVVGPLVWLAAFRLFGAYGDFDLTTVDTLRRVTGASASGTIALLLVSSWLTVPETPRTFAWLFAIALGLELVGRSLARWIAVRARRDGVTAIRTAVVGTDPEASELARLVFSLREFVPVGLIGPSPGDGEAPDSFPVVGTLHDTEAVLRRNSVRCVYVASSTLSASQMDSLSRACRRAGAELRVTTNLPAVHPSRVLVRSVEGVTALSVKPLRPSGIQVLAKRILDVVVASVTLLLTLPFIAIIAILIRLTSPGPAFFRQARVTKDGRTFTMYKFRSMVTEPERSLEGSVIDLTRPFFKLEDDPRLTRIGRALRSLSIDELPQLYNVVRGDMSLVGPRPLPVEQVQANREFLAPRHEVRGGLTGLWQVSGRSELDSNEALGIDRFYIENWSLGLDIRILFRTIGVLLTRRGAM